MPLTARDLYELWDSGDFQKTRSAAEQEEDEEEDAPPELLSDTVTEDGSEEDTCKGEVRGLTVETCGKKVRPNARQVVEYMLQVEQELWIRRRYPIPTDCNSSQRRRIKRQRVVVRTALGTEEPSPERKWWWEPLIKYTNECRKVYGGTWFMQACWVPPSCEKPDFIGDEVVDAWKSVLPLFSVGVTRFMIGWIRYIAEKVERLDPMEKQVMFDIRAETMDVNVSDMARLLATRIPSDIWCNRELLCIICNDLVLLGEMAEHYHSALRL